MERWRSLALDHTLSKWWVEMVKPLTAGYQGLLLTPWGCPGGRTPGTGDLRERIKSGKGLINHLIHLHERWGN